MPSSSSWHPWSDFGRDQSHGPCPVIFRDLILNLDLARSNVRFEMPQDSPSLKTSPCWRGNALQCVIIVGYRFKNATGGQVGNSAPKESRQRRRRRVRVDD